METDNYYELLGVSTKATLSEIKRAYRKRARECHPDITGPESSELLFRKVKEAYEVLSDADRRKVYDLKNGLLEFESFKFKKYADNQAAGDFEARRPKEEEVKKRWEDLNQKASAKENRAQSSSKIHRTPPSKSNFHPSQHSSISNPLKNMASLATSLLHRLKEGTELLTGSKPNLNKLRTANSATTKILNRPGERNIYVSIDAWEAINGTERDVALGDPRNPQMIKVQIPGNTVPGALLRITVPSTKNAPEQIVNIKVDVVPHRAVEIEGLDIVVKLPLTLAEAIIGTEIEIPTLEGPTKVRIPPQIGETKRLRLKGRGLRGLTENIRGDLFVRPQVILPDAITPAAQEAAKALDSHYLGGVRKDFPRTLKIK